MLGVIVERERKGVQRAECVDGPAELLEVGVAAGAVGEMLYEPLLGLLVQRAVQERGHQLDELVTVHDGTDRPA